ncbi:uncharacterized protein LOC114519289 [Dendronephthya gigantea]|uniref:uncharacterized protein LOC114519289 n=1 Tax=Dendronephthya gigantea TaxID=151771 RepID=UPI00106AED53|nr:uncharacterized protein LOC114519289 [Dendronephthya gigantea]XP_028395201.1 uncharacterized protein LOC114519289 [Dendronephthya gigantea]
MDATYGRATSWVYAPTDKTIEEIIQRSMKNGFNFVFLQCGSLRQVLPLPRTIKLSSKKSKKSKKKSKKINVNIILIDSISRPHFYRSMPRTIEALRHVVYNESIPATVLDFELLQSVSQHTMDNCRPLYSGVTAGVYKEFSSKWRKSIKPLGISVLFGEYQKNGYQTMFQEEGCWYDLWGLMLTDVERHPTLTDREGFAKRWKQLQERWKHYHIDDFGLTHFTCEVVKKYGQTNDMDRPKHVCFNGDYISTYYLKYHLDYLRSIREHKDSLPLLHYLHLVTGHTSYGTRIRNDDVGLATYVTQLARDPNTLTIILSDHGHTRTKYSQTVEGRFELSNPLMFVLFSENVAGILGKNKVRSLVENQQRLFTTLDIHRMLMALNNPVKMQSDDYRVNGILSVLPSNRTCENLPLTPLTRCKCEGWDHKVGDNSQRHIWLAEFALGQLNNVMQEQFMKGHKNSGYGSCIRLRGLETKNNIEKQTEKRLSVTMDLIVESAVQNRVEVFQVLIETPLLPDENIASAKLIKYDRQSLYSRYLHCVDDGVDVSLCACAKKTDNKDTIASDALRSLATRSAFGAETEVTLVDKEGCLLMLSRKHNFSISYEVANLCDKTYHFKFHGKAFNMLLTAKLPVIIVVKPRTIYFLISATRYVVNDSYFDVRTNHKLMN